MRAAPKMVPGEKHGRLTVQEWVRTDAHYRRFFVCLCDCGGTVVTHAGSLRSGNTRSCGCLAREIRAARRISLHHSSVTAVLKGYQRHAAGRGYAWHLTRSEVEELIARDCHYCGAKPSNSKVTKNSLEPLLYNGIDRSDNSRGYESGNVVPCCRLCNAAKGTLTVTDFVEWATRVAATAVRSAA